MPTTTDWVAPELFMTHNGVNVFYTYKDDDIDQGRKEYHFTLYSSEDGCDFDVRDLDDTWQRLKQFPPYLHGANNTPEVQALWDAWWAHGLPAACRAVIQEALDAGLIPLPEDMADNAHEPGTADATDTVTL